jgi:hypothetical protein|eukprot:COSAG01_NODE_2007_length_8663_cov_13.801378_1_plen_304_part_00
MISGTGRLTYMMIAKLLLILHTLVPGSFAQDCPVTSDCVECTQGTYSCGFGDTCYCEMETCGVCAHGSWGSGDSTPDEDGRCSGTCSGEIGSLSNCDDSVAVANAINSKCPTVPLGSQNPYPSTCPVECAAAVVPWYLLCRNQDSMIDLDARTSGGLSQFVQMCDDGLTITSQATSSDDCDVSRLDGKTYHIGGLDPVSGQPYWQDTRVYFVYWSSSEDNLDPGESRWYLDSNTDPQGYEAHSPSSTSDQSTSPMDSGVWREAPVGCGDDCTWADAEYRFQVDVLQLCCSLRAQRAVASVVKS